MMVIIGFDREIETKTLIQYFVLKEYVSMCLHNSRPSFSTVTSAFRVTNASTPVLCTICNKMCVPSTDGHDDATKFGNYVTPPTGDDGRGDTPL